MLDYTAPTLVFDILLLVAAELGERCEEVPLDIIETWEPDDVERVVEWAGAVHLKASDNPVRVPPMPDVLRIFRLEFLEASLWTALEEEAGAQDIMDNMPPPGAHV